MEHSVVFTVFIIFTGAAIFSTVALYLRQSLLVAYMLFGVVFGPWGFKVLANIDRIHRFDDIGIIFFMFLLGLHLQPQSLMRMVGKTAWITLVSSVVFFVVGFLVGYWCDYSLAESLIIGACMMFSSTIVSLKLFPFGTSNNQHTGEVMISVLLLQDLIAILVLLGINTTSHGKLSISEIIIIALALPGILLFVFLVERFILSKIFARFTRVREYMLLTAVSWCLGIAELAKATGLSYEIGAFIAGIAIAASPIACYIDEQLKPIRDFFLVLFFFIIGASFNFQYFHIILVPALVLTTLFMILKPIAFYFLLRHANETKNIAQEVSMRLGQLSEFSLLVVLLAYQNELVGYSVIYLVQTVTMLMFIISSYSVGARYPIKIMVD
ncbi:monovalent cation:H+ antiporter-2, CPA2 family [Gammaproteobacteria bacterium]